MSERDKFLTEAMGGKKGEGCMLDISSEDDALLCVIDDPQYTKDNCCFAEAGDTKETCGEWKEFIVGGITDFSTWQGFGKLWEWAQEQEWLEEFLNIMDVGEYIDADISGFTFDIQKEFVNPDRFANAVYKFLKDRQRGV